MSEREPAEVFSLAEFVGDEMEARGWTTDDVGARFGNDSSANALRVALILSGTSDGLVLTDRDFADLARAFEVSADYFRNLDAEWRKWPDRRSPYSAPDSLFGPLCRSTLRRMAGGEK